MQAGEGVGGPLPGAALPCVPLPRVLRLFWAGSVAAFLLMVLVGYVEYRLGYPPPHYNPLGGARYEDLMEFPPVFKLLHTEAFFGGVGGSRVAYPPLGAVLYALLYATGHPVRWYLGTAAVWLAAAVWGVRRGLIAQGISGVTATLFPLTVALVSFPIAGLLQRGNIELFVWIFTAVGAWEFVRGRDDAAAVLWGLAAAVKLYPVVLLALLLPRRQVACVCGGSRDVRGGDAGVAQVAGADDCGGVARFAGECVWLPGPAGGRVDAA